MNPHQPFDGEILFLAGTEELTASMQRRYVRVFKNAPGPVLEVGSGKGAMLSLFQQEQISAYGIDLSPEAVAYCRQKGLEVLKADVLGHLSSIVSNSLGGIFCAHVIEHLHPADAITFLKESYRVLRPSGKLVLITPNAKDLRLSERFWLDVTHVRPYPRKLLDFLLRREGFTKMEFDTGPEPASNILIRAAKLFLRVWFMGFMYTGDLVVIAER